MPFKKSGCNDQTKISCQTQTVAPSRKGDVRTLIKPNGMWHGGGIGSWLLQRSTARPERQCRRLQWAWYAICGVLGERGRLLYRTECERAGLELCRPGSMPVAKHILRGAPQGHTTGLLTCFEEQPASMG